MPSAAATPRFPPPDAVPGGPRERRRGRTLASVAVGTFGRITSAVAPLAGLRFAQRLQKLFTDTHMAIYRASGGNVMGWFDTVPILLLTTTGRKTRQRRTAPVMFVPGPEPALVASNAGAKRHPQWYLNLRAHPAVTIQIGRDTYEARAEDAEGEERERLWARAVELYPAYARYQSHTDRQIPVVALRRSDDPGG